MGLLRLLALLAIFGASVSAQATTSAATTTAAAAATTSAAQTSTTAKTTSASAATTATSSAALPGLVTTTNKNQLPSLSTAQLPGITQTNVPTYQVVIPNVADNPFLEKSNYPDGTVFIIVGSCLAGLALLVIGWRTAYVWCLHRQTKERRKQQKYTEMGEQRPYAAVNGTSSNGAVNNNNPFARDISMEYLRPGDRKSQVSLFSRPSTGRTATNQPRPVSSVDPVIPSNVQFYSPSAHPGGSTAAALGTQAADRSSAYLPAGYYLRDASPAANGSATPTSPRQTSSTPASSTLLLPDQVTAQLARANRSSVSVVSGNAGRAASVSASVYGGPPTRPLSTNYPPSPGNHPPPRRTGTSYTEAPAGDRRSKPSQLLDDLLGGRS